MGHEDGGSNEHIGDRDKDKDMDKDMDKGMQGADGMQSETGRQDKDNVKWASGTVHVLLMPRLDTSPPHGHLACWRK
ncbi:hypothetical protein BN1708_001390 [Verticillium longisporum]|uniref:Uncharacterized protein n=1 Tax=Verticillium longisporum TaxID=100787 RepID=A0A0G4MSY9_VERLO|nr:hypothetical protein BN1708_001390 [Verticillium longisporum]